MFNDKKFATVMFWLFLVPTIFFCFMVAGSVVFMVSVFTGIVSGSAAAGGTFVLLYLVIFTPLALGFISMERGFWRRMRVSAAAGQKLRD